MTPTTSGAGLSTRPWRQLWRNRDGTKPILEEPMTKKLQVSVQAAGELACRPGSVHPLARAGGHPSRTAVAGSLVRSTREHRAGRRCAQLRVLPAALAKAGALP